MNGSLPLSDFQVIVNNKKISSDDKARILVPKAGVRIRFEKPGYMSSAASFQFYRDPYANQQELQVSFQTHKTQVLVI